MLAMSIPKSLRPILAVCAYFALAILACNAPITVAPGGAGQDAAPAEGAGEPAPQAETVQPGLLAQIFPTAAPATATLAVTSGDLQSFEVKIEAAEAGFASTGQVTLILTEAELNAALLNAIAEEGLTDELPVEDINVRLDTQQVLIYARLTSPPNPSGVISLSPGITTEGSLDLQLSGVAFGGVPLPPGLFDSLVAELEGGINEWLSEDSAPVRITAVVISEGTMTLSAIATP